jgi:hypothetical protein
MATQKPDQPDNTEWMVVYTTYDLTDAHVVGGLLETASIPFFIHRPVGAGAFGLTVGSLGEITVLVHSRHYQQALLLLEPDELDSLPDMTDTINYHWDDDDDSE